MSSLGYLVDLSISGFDSSSAFDSRTVVCDASTQKTSKLHDFIGAITNYIKPSRAFLVLALLWSTTQVGANATPVVFVCNYPSFSDGKGIHKHEPFELGFLVMEPKDEKGTVFGNNGSEPVSIVKNDEGGVTFVEFTQTGAVQVTAIDSNLKSVHSRHTIIGGNLVPTQYYGKCQRKEKASNHPKPQK